MNGGDACSYCDTGVLSDLVPPVGDDDRISILVRLLAPQAILQPQRQIVPKLPVLLLFQGAIKGRDLIGLPFFAQIHQLRHDCILVFLQNVERVRRILHKVNDAGVWHGAVVCHRQQRIHHAIKTQPVLVGRKDRLGKQKALPQVRMIRQSSDHLWSVEQVELPLELRAP